MLYDYLTTAKNNSQQFWINEFLNSKKWMPCIKRKNDNWQCQVMRADLTPKVAHKVATEDFS